MSSGHIVVVTGNAGVTSGGGVVTGSVVVVLTGVIKNGTRSGKIGAGYIATTGTPPPVGRPGGSGVGGAGVGGGGFVPTSLTESPPLPYVGGLLVVCVHGGGGVV